MYEFTFQHEIGKCPGKYCSLHPHWPGRKSGVTIGPGYDMGNRSARQIIDELTTVGINREIATILSHAAGKKGQEARTWVTSHQDIQITHEQERELFNQVLLPEYERRARTYVDSRFGKDTWQSLDQNQKAMLFDIAYNIGSLKKFPKFTKAVVEKDWQTALQEYERPGATRRNANFKGAFLDPKLAVDPPQGSPEGGIVSYQPSNQSSIAGSWNQTDAFSQAGQPRLFVPPVADFTVDKSAFVSITEKHFPGGESDRTSDVVLTIDIDGDVANGSPNPALKLRAISKGLITFQPADDTMSAHLILDFLTTFLFIPQTVRWWNRWLEAGCYPAKLIYENIDVAHLEDMLRTLPVGTVGGANLPRFPSGVTESNKDDFIDNFLAGQPGHFLIVEPGDYMGIPAFASDNSSAFRQLKLHAQYFPIEGIPDPMNPRELLYLLFGENSPEAILHPFLQRMSEIGQTDHPEFKGMLLRPPLRTWARVMWEAQQEIDYHASNWQKSGSLGPTRFYNDHARNDLQGVRRRFNDGSYTGLYKCNLFVSDICLRAGFRVCIHPVGNKDWHYINANSYTNLTHQTDGAELERVPLTGRIGRQTITWGMKIENWLRTQPATERLNRLNEAMFQEGRCFIVAGTRNTFGHIVIVKEVLAQPYLQQTPGSGLQKIKVQTVEARGGEGALSRVYYPRLGGVGGPSDRETGFTRLHLFELYPGKDPDLRQGLHDLNVRNRVL